eukprot:gene711-8963_t
MSKILYEVEEYPLKKLKKFVTSESNEKSIFIKAFNGLRCKNEPDNLKSLLDINEWDITISEDGTTLSILQEDDLIIKTIQNETLKTTATFKLPKDDKKHLRKIFISKNGETIVSYTNQNQILFFSKKKKQLFRKISLTDFIKNGLLKNLFVLNHDEIILLVGNEMIKFEKEICFRMNLNELLTPIFSFDLKDDSLFITTQESNNKIRLKNTSLDKIEFIKIPQGGEYETQNSTIIKTLTSPNQKIIAVLDVQQHLQFFSFENKKSQKLKFEFTSILDFIWWNDESIVLLTDEYEMKLINLKTNDSLIEEEKLELAGLSKFTKVIDGNLYFLECEVEDVIEVMPERGNIFYGVYQLFYSMVYPEKEKTFQYSLFYKLIGFKEKKPISVLVELLKNQKYTEAIAYAKFYKLSDDLIFKYQWNDSEKEEGDFGLLEQIEDKEWVINECMECSTDTVEKKKELLNFADHLCNKMNRETSKIEDFLSKLETYLQIHSFDWEKVKKFCDTDLFESIELFSSEENFSAIEVIFTRHSEEVLPKYLEILSSISEVTDPFSYENLLPKYKNDQLVPWQCLEGKFEFEYDKKSITNWYISRAYEIESKCGFINNSLALLEIGMKNNVIGLESLYYIVSSVNYQVYECNSDITIKDFENLNDKEKIELLLSNVSQEKDIIFDIISNKAKEFLNKDKKTGKDSFLYDLMMRFAICDFSICHYIFIENQKGNESIFPDDKTHQQIAMDCIYQSNASDQWKQVKDIFKTIPEPQEKHLVSEYQTLENRLNSIEILSEYDCFILPKLIINFEKGQKSRNLFLKMIKYCVRKSYSEMKFKNLLTDLIQIHSILFINVSEEFIHEEFLKGCCEASHFQLVLDYIFIDKIISLEIADEILYETTKHLVNSINSTNDKSIDLALNCVKAHSKLNIIDLKWEMEENLLKIVGIIKKFKNYKLPVQMRYIDNKMIIIEDILENNEDSYKNSNSIQKIADFLNVGNIMPLIIDHAILDENFDFAIMKIKESMEENDEISFHLCEKLLQMNQIKDDEKSELVSYALKHCPIEMISTFVKYSKEIELKKSKEISTESKNKKFFFVDPFYSNQNLIIGTEIQDLKFSQNEEVSKFCNIQHSKHLEFQEEMISFAIQFFSMELSIDEMKQFFDDLYSEENGEQICSLATYIFALKSIQQKDENLEENMIKEPKELINHVTTKNPDDEVTKLIKYFQAKKIKSINNNELKSYLNSVDLSEFKKNQEYRRECISKISNSSDVKDYEYAMKLSKEFDIDSYEPTLNYVKNLLDSKFYKGSIEIQNEIILLSDEILKKNVDKSLELINQQFKNIDSNNADQVLFFFEIFYILDSKNSKIPLYKNLIVKLKDFDLDFLSFFFANSSEDVYEIFKDILNDKNLETFLEILSLLDFIKKETILKLFIQNHLHQYNETPKDKLKKVEKFFFQLQTEKDDFFEVLNQIMEMLNKNILKIEFLQKVIKKVKAFTVEMKKILLILKLTENYSGNVNFENFIFKQLINDEITILDSVFQVVILKRDTELIEEYLNDLKDIHYEVFSKGENDEKYLQLGISEAYEQTILFLLTKLENSKNFIQLDNAIDDDYLNVKMENWNDLSHENCLIFFELILIELSSSFDDFVENSFSLVEDFIEKEEINKIPKLNVLSIAMKYIQEIDDSMLIEFKIKNEFENLNIKNIDCQNWEENFEGILTKSKNESDIKSVVNLIEISKTKKTQEFLVRIVDVLFELQLFCYLIEILLHEQIDDKTQKNMFFKLISVDQPSFAFQFSTQSKFKKVQNLTIEHLKLKKESIQFEESWIGNLILNGHSIEIVNLDDHSFDQILKLNFEKKIQLKLVSDLILNDDYLHSFDFVSKRAYGLSDYLMEFSNCLLMVELFLKKEKGYEKALKKIQHLK